MAPAGASTSLTSRIKGIATHSTHKKCSLLMSAVRVYIILYKGKDYCHNSRELPSITPFFRVMLC